MKKDCGYEYFDHTGDIGIRVYGQTMSELFDHARMALLEIIIEPDLIHPLIEKRIVIENNGWERLLVSWLNEFLYLFEAEGWLCRECRIEVLNEKRIEAIGSGEQFDPERHEIKTEIKAVTYHQLAIEKRDHQWQTNIIFDV